MTDTTPSWQVPARLSRIKDLVYNLWWSWHPEARALFKEIDQTVWNDTQHNPVLLLQRSGPRLEAVAKDPGFLERYDAVISDLDRYLSGAGAWFPKAHPQFAGKSVAYFSAEFGLHNSLKIYSGGLGVLAGDHCKTASDLGVPLVGVGFMYPQGYVQQRVSADGWQQNVYEQIDWGTAPVRRARDARGEPLLLDLKIGSWALKAAVWEVVVGRVRLYLMDTHVDANAAEDREISGRLYGGDRLMRLRQEMVLGIGGVRLLRALGVQAAAYHANEGHSAFLYLELIRELVASGKSFADAAREVAAQSVFTTHTPVEAGHDVFDEALVAQYFRDYLTGLGLSAEEFLALARVPGENGWNMTALALRLSGRRNAVSRRHGQVSRKMWSRLWPEKPEDEVPIAHVTNGVHLATWVEQDLGRLFDRHLGADWREKQDDPALWSKVAAVPDEELWKVHQENKEFLFELLHRRSRKAWMEGRMDPGQVLAQGALLDPRALTIGFARRFAGYKRAALVFRDLPRLKALLLDQWRPVQLVFAGKAHPADDSGKALIQQVYRLARDPALGGRVAFVEDYDMHVARYFVHGCDLWLNNPLAPLEACGTSGMKAAVNGVPNLSVLDGWWEEGYNGTNGWPIGAPGGRGSGEAADAADANDLYEALEKRIIPLFYERGEDAVPRGWTKAMKESIRSVAPRFSGDRMVKEYADRFYAASLAQPAARP